MKKNTTRKKRKKLNLAGMTAFVFLSSIILYVGFSLFLGTYNNSLSSEKQKIENDIAELQVQNDAVAVEVNSLSNRERVNSIASDNGLSLDQENIVTITKNDSGE